MTPSSGPTGPRPHADSPAFWLKSGILIALLAGSSVASTEQAHGSLGVSAIVTPVARIELASREPDLLLTKDDLDRGYIESPQPLHLTVYSNSRNGFALDVLPVSPLFSAVSVQGLDSEVLLSSGGGTVTQRWGHPQKVSLELRFSFTIADGIQPGLYPWPVRLAARPLDQ
ncbi:MAG: hypothetical protein ABL964_13780 [Steroidobacteraceae bacterium]